MDEPTLVLLAKKPIPGFVKTRLLAHLSPNKAAQLSLAMVTDIVGKASQCWNGPTKLLVSPDPDHPALIELSKKFQVEMAPQVAGDLGQKMEEALVLGLKYSPAAAVMGCDLPWVTGALLHYASDKLTSGSNAIGPTADGGFYFVGIQQYRKGMFGNIQWSCDSVFRNALIQAAEVGLHYDVVLPCQQDIDEFADLEYLARNRPEYAKFIQ